MDRKTIIATLSGLLIAAVFAVLWNIISKGTEATIGDNPAIVAIQAQADETDDVLAAHLLSVEARLVRVETKLDLIIDQSNAILVAHQ